jgi:hypothetical protein
MRLVMSEAEKKQEEFRRDCFARWMLARLKRYQIDNWLATHPGSADDMRRRLNEQKEFLKQSEAA